MGNIYKVHLVNINLMDKANYKTDYNTSRQDASREWNEDETCWILANFLHYSAFPISDHLLMICIL